MSATTRATDQGASAVETPPVRIMRIEPSRGWVSLQLQELWEYRELLFYLSWRDVTVRYKQTLLGASWAIIQPVTSMVIFSLVFGKLAKMPSDGIPYPIFSYSGLLPWGFFAASLGASSASVVSGARMIKKVYFPRLVIPIASVGSSFVDFSIAFTVLVVMMIYYGVAPSINVIWLPFFCILAIASSLGMGLWLSATNARYRDIRHVMPFLTHIWMYATPVVYPSSLVPEQWRTLYALNPMVSVVDGFRWALLGSGSAPGWTTVASAVGAIIILISGAYYFRRMERTLADVL